jgi:3-hydroxybutyryl-CoA dehydratase
METPLRRGLYFEEFEVGQKILSVGRTITESDIITFASLSGDYNQIHTDAEFSKNSLFGQRVAHGLLILSIASGLAMRTGVLEGTAIAFREINDWKFVKPVFIGDTIHVELVIREAKAYARIHAGAIYIDVEVKNQHEDTVMKGNWVALVASRMQKSSE